MSELPPPDLLDTAGRLRRMFVASFVGVGAAVVVYLVSDAAIEPEKQLTTGGYKFVYYFTGLAGAVGLVATAAIQGFLLRRRARDEQIPRAQVR